MRLEGDETVETVGCERAHRLPELAITLAGRHHRAVSRQGVLHLEVGDVRGEHRVRLAERTHAALDEVGVVPGEGQRRTADRFDDVEAASGDVAEDILLVLVDQGDPGVRGDRGEVADAGDHLVAVVIGVGIGGDEVGEHPDVGGAEEVRDLCGMTHPVQVRPVVVGDWDLADRRADAGDAKAGSVKGRLGSAELGGVEVEDVHVPRRTQLDVFQAEAGYQRHLLVEVGGDLVGKSGKRPHVTIERRHAMRPQLVLTTNGNNAGQ